MATFYGTATDCTTDVPLVSVTISDPRKVIGQRQIRRLTTPRGGLAVVGGDPNGGWDIRRYVLSRISTSTTGIGEQQVAAECLKDEQVQSAVATFTYVGKKLTIAVACISAAGPFSLTIVLTPTTDIDALVQALVTF